MSRCYKYNKPITITLAWLVGVILIVSCEEKQSASRDSERSSSREGSARASGRSDNSFEARRRQMRVSKPKEKSKYSIWLRDSLKGVSSVRERQAIIHEALAILSNSSIENRCVLIQEFTLSEASRDAMIRHLFSSIIKDEESLSDAVKSISSLAASDVRGVAIEGIINGLCVKETDLETVSEQIHKYEILHGSEAAYNAALEWYSYSDNLEQNIRTRFMMLNDETLPLVIKERVITEISDGLGRGNLNDAIDFLKQRKVISVPAWQAAISNVNGIDISGAEYFRDAASDEVWQLEGVSIVNKLANSEGIHTALMFIKDTEPNLRINLTSGLASVMENVSDKDFLHNMAEAKRVLTKMEVKNLAGRLLALEKATESSASRMTMLEAIIRE